MITVGKALSYDVCSGFRLVAGENGLNNVISVVGFFEWEKGEELMAAFNRGIFVLTTLSMFRDDIKMAERSLKLMINNGVAAIAIKDIFFSDVSDDLKAYAEVHHVPIFFFSDTYINEIIRTIQNAVTDDRKYSVDGLRLESLIKDNLNEEKQNRILREIHPYLNEAGAAVLYFSDAQKETGRSLNLIRRYEEHIFRLEMMMRALPGYEDIVYSVVTYKRGFFLLLNEAGEGEEKHLAFLKELQKHILKEKLFCTIHIGICESTQPGNGIRRQLCEAIYANVRAILNDRRFCSSNEIGIDGVIFGNIGTAPAKRYFEEMLRIITDAEANNTPFTETILVYVKSGGNIETTANLLHQHRNTVRYRIEKIHKLFGDDDEITFMGKLFYFVRLYQARPYLDQMI